MCTPHGGVCINKIHTLCSSFPFSLAFNFSSFALPFLSFPFRDIIIIFIYFCCCYFAFILSLLVLHFLLYVARSSIMHTLYNERICRTKVCTRETVMQQQEQLQQQQTYRFSSSFAFITKTAFLQQSTYITLK